jgi:L-fucose mutarotase/ribose pyranase (RbsD/FucU family)
MNHAGHGQEIVVFDFHHPTPGLVEVLIKIPVDSATLEAQSFHVI